MDQNSVKRKLGKLEELQRLRLQQARRNTLSRRKFRETYRDDPVAFVHDCFDWSQVRPPPGREAGPADYQEDILSHIPIEKRVAVRGPHGPGKTSLDAWVLLWFAETRDGGPDWKVLTTASAWRQLDFYLWPEVHKWARLLRWDVLGREPYNERTELQEMGLKLTTGEAFAVACDQPASIEGAHAVSLCYIYDEAKAIPEPTWNASEGAFAGAGPETGNEAFALANSTPGAAEGVFYRIHAKQKQGWWTRHITLEEAIAAGRVAESWAKEREEEWGASNPLYINRVLGNFADQDETAAIPIAWVEEANRRWEELHAESGEMPLTAVGIDCADTGKDMTVLAPRRGWFVDELRYFPGGGRTLEGEPAYGEEVMATIGRSRRFLEANRDAKAIVDVMGFGAGVVGGLREEFGLKRVLAYNGMIPTDWTDNSGELRFLNVRAAAYYRMGELLNPRTGPRIALPPDNTLIGDLTAPKWLPETSAGKMRLEKKEDLVDRLGRSPDAGDAVVMAFWIEAMRSQASTNIESITSTRI